jgi:hypothetical protein
MTTTISKDAIDLAQNFVRAEGRPLDRALLGFSDGLHDSTTVLAELSKFQNEDGGFGHGLEPDITTPASTAIATSIAFGLLCRIEAPASAQVVQRALSWLEETIDWDAGVWPIITPDIDLASHAPWWNYTDNLRQRWNGFRFNPTADLLGALYCYREDTSGRLLQRAEERLLATLEATAPTESYDLLCAVRLLEGSNTPSHVKRPLKESVLRSIQERDADDAHASFLGLAPAPTSTVAKSFPERVDPALAALISAQQPDGSWRPFWNWSEIDETAWRNAERSWAGILTRQALETLKAYNAVA